MEPKFVTKFACKNMILFRYLWKLCLLTLGSPLTWMLCTNHSKFSKLCLNLIGEALAYDTALFIGEHETFDLFGLV